MNREEGWFCTGCDDHFGTGREGHQRGADHVFQCDGAGPGEAATLRYDPGLTAEDYDVDFEGAEERTFEDRYQENAARKGNL